MAIVTHVRTKAVTAALWTPTILLAILFASSAIDKLSGGAIADFTRWGYPAWFMVVIGVVELVSVVALVIPRLASLGAAGMVAVLLGAFFTIVAHPAADTDRLPITVVAFVLALVVGWARWRDFAALPTSR